MTARQTAFFDEPVIAPKFNARDCIDIWCGEWLGRYGDDYKPLDSDVGALKSMLRALPSMDADTWRSVSRRACAIGRRVSLGIVARNVNEYTAETGLHGDMMAAGRRFLERHREDE